MGKYYLGTGNNNQINFQVVDSTGVINDLNLSGLYLSATGKAVDADKLDSYDSSYFRDASNLTGVYTGQISGGGIGNADTLDGYDSSYFLNASNITGTLGLNATGLHYISGSLGIGIASPTQKLDVSGSALIRTNLFIGGIGALSIENAGQEIIRSNGSILLRAGGSQASRGGIQLLNNAGITIDGGTSFSNGVDLKGGGGHVYVSQGNFGIGTTSPGQLLSLSSAVALGTAINIINTDTGGYNWNIFSAGSAGTIGSAGSLVFRDSTNGVSRMVIKNDGNVGIGTTAPGARFEVRKTDGGNAFRFANYVDGGSLGAWVGTYGAEFRTVTSGSVSHGMLINNNEANDARRTLDISDSNGVFATFTNGKVGIGTTSPDAKLQVELNVASQTDGIRLKNSHTGGWGHNLFFNLFDYTNSASYDVITAQTRYAGGPGGYLEFSGKNQSNSAAVSVMTLRGSGNVGIGTTAPGAKLHSYGGSSGGTVSSNSNLVAIESNGNNGLQFLNPSANNANINFGDEGNNEIGFIQYQHGTDAMRFRAGGTTIMSLVTGSVGIGTTTPNAALNIHKAFTASGLYEAKTISITTDNVSSNWTLGQIVGYVAAGASNSASGFPGGLMFKTKAADGNTGESGVATRMVIDAAGNVGIGTTSPGYLLDVNGNARIVTSLGVGTTPNGTAGYLSAQYGNFSSYVTTPMVFSSSGLNLDGNVATGAGYIISITNQNTFTGTAGISGVINYSSLTFAPTSGTQVWNGLNISPTINQTGGANGITRGVYVAPTLTAAANFRAIETTVGNVIFGSTSGSVGIGTASPTATLHVSKAVNADWLAKFVNTGTNPYGLYVDTSANAGSEYTFAAYTNAGTGLLLRNNGNFGVGTASPIQKLDVSGVTGGPLTSGTSADGSLRLSSGYDMVLDVGVNHAVSAWIQCRNKTGYGSNYNLALNPNGGNVGIGQASPSYKLEVETGVGDADGIRVRDSAVGVWTDIRRRYIECVGGDFWINSQSSSLDLRTANSSKLFITLSGNVGIGTTVPNQKFEVTGGAIIASGFGNRAAGTGKALEIGMDGTQGVLQAYDRSFSTHIPLAISASTTTFSGAVTAQGTGTHTFGTTNTVTMTAGVLTTQAASQTAAIKIGNFSNAATFSAISLNGDLSTTGMTGISGGGGGVNTLSFKTPSSYGFSFAVNNAEVASISSTGAATFAGNITVSGTGTSSYGGTGAINTFGSTSNLSSIDGGIGSTAAFTSSGVYYAAAFLQGSSNRGITGRTNNFNTGTSTGGNWGIDATATGASFGAGTNGTASGGTITFTAPTTVSLLSTTASSSAITGALQVAGGIGVAGASFFGGSETYFQSSTGNTNLISTRAGTSNGATFQYKTGATLKWYHGLRGLVNDNFYIHNQSTDVSVLVLDVATNAATFAGAVTIGGNLTVNGTTTTVNSTTVTVDDPIITLGGDTAPTVDDNKDRGIEFKWHNGTIAKAGFFGFDDSTGYLTFIPDATNTSEVFSGTVGDIQAANFRGNLIGNVTGNVSGSAGSVATLTAGTYLTGGSFNGSANVTFAVDATSANTASKVVARDASGNFSAGAITANNDVTTTTGKFATSASGQSVGMQLDGYVNAGSFNNYILNNSPAAGTYATLNFGRTTGLLFGFVRSNNNTEAIEIGTAATTRMTISSAGNVGIGTTSPSYKFQVESALAANATFTTNSNMLAMFKNTTSAASAWGGIKLQADEGSGIWFSDESGTSMHGYISTRYTGQMDFATGQDSATAATVKMSILTSGNVGIGTASPTNRMEIRGVSGAPVASGTVQTALGLTIAADQWNCLDFGNNSTSDYAWIQSTRRDAKSIFDKLALNPNGGNVGIGTTSPGLYLDIRQVNESLPATSGTAQTGILRLGSSNAGHTGVLDFGTAPGAITWLQATDRTSLSSTYILSLNPNGGNVGIGTTSPISKLQIAGTSGNLLTVGTLTNNWGGDVAIGISNANGIIVSKINTSNDANRVLVFYRDDTNGATIYGYTPSGGSGNIGFQIRANASSYFNGGNVGIGTTSPGAKLESVSTDATSALWLRNNNVSGVTNNFSQFITTADSGKGLYQGVDITNRKFYWRVNDSNDYGYQWQNAAGGNLVTILNSGNVGIGTTNPITKLQVAVPTQNYASFGNTGYGAADWYGLHVGYTEVNNSLYRKTMIAYEGLADGAARGNLHLLVNTVSSSASATIADSKLMISGITGNVGIGTTSPLGTLDIGKSNSSPSLVIGNSNYTSSYNSIWGLQSGAQSIMIFGNNGQNEIRAGNTVVGGYLDFYTNNTAAFTSASNGNFAMRLAASGNVGIGTTSPGAKLEVAGGHVRLNGTYNGVQFGYTGAAANEKVWMIQPSGDHKSFLIGTMDDSFTGMVQQAVNILRSGTTVTQVTFPNGNVGIGTASPGAKLDIRPTSDGDVGLSIGTGGTVSAIINAPANLYINADIANAQSGAGTIVFGFNRVAFSGGTTVMTIKESGGNVGIGTTTPGYKLEVNGSFAATTKSFVIKHPTKEGKKLRYGSLEGPENGVYIRGKTTSKVIELPDYWTKLVDPDSISVQLTSIGSHQKLYVEKIENNKVYIANENLLAKSINCFFYILAERADVEKLQVEIDA